MHTANLARPSSWKALSFSEFDTRVSSFGKTKVFAVQNFRGNHGGNLTSSCSKWQALYRCAGCGKASNLLGSSFFAIPFVSDHLVAATTPRKQRRNVVSCGMREGTSPLVGRRDFTAVMIVPTGVGAAIGGFAGDALPTARALASVVDCLITHPNVLNGAMLYWPIPNALYVEGYGLDRFAAGELGLQPVHQNKVGLVLDAGMEEDLRLRHLQVADAARATLGLSVTECVVTDAPLQVEKWIDGESGASTGRVGRPDSLLRAVDALLEGGNVDAVAVVGRFPDDSLDLIEDYRHGQGVDALAGVEAVISRTVVQHFHVPCAHAPALQPIPLDPTISPRSAAEELGHTFLPCVLAGLSRAPQFITDPESKHWTPGDSPRGQGSAGLWVADVDAVVLPADVCGGSGVRSFARGVPGVKGRRRKPVLITVDENKTVMGDPPEKHSMETVRVQNYWEAIGVVAALKAGVSPMSLRVEGVSSFNVKPAPESRRQERGSDLHKIPIGPILCH